MRKSTSLPTPEGLLEDRPTAVTTMNACLYANCIVVCRRKATYCAQKWVITGFYNTGLLRTAVFNMRLVALNRVVFIGLLQFQPNAAPSDVNEAEVGRG